MITAHLARVFHVTDDLEVIRWQRRTIRLAHGVTLAEFTAYLARCHRAAPALMAELAELKSWEGSEHDPEFGEQAGPLLAELRREVSGYVLTPDDWDQCQRLAAKAAEHVRTVARLPETTGTISRVST